MMMVMMMMMMMMMVLMVTIMTIRMTISMIKEDNVLGWMIGDPIQTKKSSNYKD